MDGASTCMGGTCWRFDDFDNFRMACIPGGITSVQIIRVIKKYLADNPDKAHRATRLVASVALARAFRCKAAK